MQIVQKPKVAIYGIGFFGKLLVQLAHEKGCEIVAAYNRAGEKVGQDIGRLAGLEKDIGVIVEDSAVADYASSGADIVLVAAGNTLADNFEAYEKYLSAGINVLCHGTESYCPRWYNPELATKIDKLAKDNGVTFTGSGIWDVSRMWAGMLIAGAAVQIDGIEHISTTDIMRQNGTKYFPFYGIGLAPEQVKEKFSEGMGIFAVYHVPAIMVLEKLGYTVTGYKDWLKPIVAEQDFYCEEADQHINAGTSIGLEICSDVYTEQGVTAKNRVEHRIFNGDEIEDIRWRINGRPGMEVSVLREDSGLFSAASLFNRIPDVLSAPPGIVEVTDLCLMRPSVEVLT